MIFCIFRMLFPANRFENFWGFRDLCKTVCFFWVGGFEIILFCKGREFCRSERQFGCMVKINRVIRSSPLRFQRNGKVKLTAVFIFLQQS